MYATWQANQALHGPGHRGVGFCGLWVRGVRVRAVLDWFAKSHTFAPGPSLLLGLAASALFHRRRLPV